MIDPLGFEHVHTLRCYWEPTQARWLCRPARDAATVFPAQAVTVPDLPQPLSAAAAGTGPDRSGTGSS